MIDPGRREHPLDRMARRGVVTDRPTDQFGHTADDPVLLAGVHLVQVSSRHTQILPYRPAC